VAISTAGHGVGDKPRRIANAMEYELTLARIRRLQQELCHATLEPGGWSARALALSQEIDGYVVMVQRYWDGLSDDDAVPCSAKASW
jgi:hypothetical protein